MPQLTVSRSSNPAGSPRNSDSRIIAAVFSSRIPSNLSPNPISRALELARRRGPLVDLTESNPTRAGFTVDPHRMTELLATPDAIRYEPDPRGWIGARRSVAEYYAARGASVDPDRVVLTASTSEGYALLFKLLCDAGDDVLVPSPSYPLFEHLANAECVRAAPYQLDFDGRWRLDSDELERVVSPRTKAVVVVSPNNPTGSVLTTDEVRGVADFCVRRGAALICDEVFADYPHRLPHRAARAPFECDGVVTFTLNGLSKIVGVPQLKAAWILVDGTPDQVAEVMPRLEFLADLYLSVGTPVQRALPGLLALAPETQAAIRDVLGQNLVFLRESTAGTAVDGVPVEAGWAAVLRIPRILDDESFVLRLLDEEATFVQPGYFYDFAREGFVVVSLLTPPPVFRDGVARLLSLVARL